MGMRTLAVALTCLLLSGSVAVAQTPAIQKKVENKLGELKKAKSALDDLLALALKNHPDIRVAESKQRDADVALYRMRMQVLEKVTMLHYEIKAARAAANEAKARAQRDQAAYGKGTLAAAELSASIAAQEKFHSDWERLVAQMEFLTGKHTEKTAKWLAIQPDGRELWSSSSHGSSGIQVYSLKVVRADAVAAPTPIAGPLTEKLRQALDQPFTVGPKEKMLATSELPALLRKYTKGVNILKEVKDGDVPANLPFHEPIPLGALYQWIEDEFNWRFIIRDYGIVGVDRNTVPPGAVLLLDFWHKDKAMAAPK
jgi:hypothetical protein